MDAMPRNRGTETPGRTASASLPRARPGDGTGPLGRLFRLRGGQSAVARNRTIATEGEPISRVYRIETGFVRCCTYTEDGVRQIFAFAGPGDVLGFPDIETWHFTAEAVGAATLRWLRPDVLEDAIARDPGVRLALREQCLSQFRRRELHLVWLSCLQSEERLLAFLRDFARSAPTEDGFCRLPMTRHDLGDHLGMTLETVSRAFGALRGHGLIATRGATRFRLASDASGVRAA